MEPISYISADEIKKMNEKLGKQISQEYAKILVKDEEIMVIVTLRGALYFAADLTREITVPLNVDFVRLASYGTGTKSSGTVRLEKDIEMNPEGRHVLVLDEIVDSGRTLKFLFERLQAQKPKSLKLCALLSKPSRREVEVKVDYLGKEVEDKFLVGYGLDFKEHYRNLKDISYIPT
jgi:hypoxanthine phosphoribosyltransferase